MGLLCATAGVTPGQDAVDRWVPAVARSEIGKDRLQAATLLMQARILQRRARPVLALRKYQRAWRLDRDARVVLKQIVPLALELGRVAEATRYAVLLADSDLDDPFLAERMAMLMSDQLEIDRSLQLYQHVLKLRGDDPAARNPIAMHFEMGRLYFLTGKYKQASQSFRVVLDALENPNAGDVPRAVRAAILEKPERTYQLIAESFLEAGEYQDARAMFLKALQHGGSDDWLNLQLARVDYRAGQYALAREHLEDYMQQKLSFGGHTPYQLLQTLMEERPIEKAQENDSPIKRFQAWLADDPENVDLLSFVADLTRRRGVLIDAAALYEKLLTKQPSLEAYQGLVSIYRELGDGDKLLNALARVTNDINSLEPFAEDVKAIIKDRDFLSALFRIGREKLKTDAVFGKGIGIACGLIALNAKDYGVAEEFLSDVDQSDVYITWGLELLLAEENERAVHVFQTALASQADPDTRAVLLYYLSGAWQMTGQTDEALKAAREAVDLRGDMPDFAIRPAWILFNAQRYEEAEQEYVAWLNQYAEDYSLPGIRGTVREARFVMSSICSDTDRFEEAVEYLEQVLDEFPEDVGVMNDLGYLFVDHGVALKRATKMIRRAVAAEPNNTAYRDSLGWALYRQGDYDGALRELRRAAKGHSPDPIILDHLAIVLRARGDRELAEQTWKQALQQLQANPDPGLQTEIERKLAERTVESK